MPPATSLALSCVSDRAITAKLAIIPFSVPTRPIIGPSVPSTASMLIFRSISTVSASALRSITSRASGQAAGQLGDARSLTSRQ